MSLLSTLLFLTGVGSLIAWLLVYAGVMVATRPRSVRPDPPTEIGDASRPAVVNLLTNRWRCTMDAARATLVDFINRDYLRVREDGPDPAQTVIEIINPDPPSLTRYERRMMARLWSLSQHGEVPLPALAFRTRRAAARWLHRFTSEVAADARAKDLARPGITTDFLIAAALLPALTLGVWTYLRVPSDRLFSAVAVVVAVLLILYQLASPVHERHRPSPAGRGVAAHWLGVRADLRNRRPELADLTLVKVKDWQVGYAVALGLATTLSEQLQFAPVHVRKVVTRNGGLKVRFPDRMRFCWGWGAFGCATAAATALLGALAFGVIAGWYGDHLPAPVTAFCWVLTAGFSVATLGLVGLAVADVASTFETTGEVVLLEGYGHDSARDPRLEGRYVLALASDSEPVPAWILPSDLGQGLSVGCTVTARVRRWTGLITQLAIAGATGSRAATSAAASASTAGSKPHRREAASGVETPMADSE